MADFEAERAIMREAYKAWFPKGGQEVVRVDITVGDGRKFGFDAFPVEIGIEEQPLGFSLTLESTGKLDARPSP